MIDLLNALTLGNVMEEEISKDKAQKKKKCKERQEKYTESLATKDSSRDSPSNKKEIGVLIIVKCKGTNEGNSENWRCTAMSWCA